MGQLTVEAIELRKILTQMLADNGINRTTIKDFVREIIEEKVKAAVAHELTQLNLTDMSREELERLVSSGITQSAREAVRKRVNSIFSNIYVTVELGNDKPKD